MIIDAHQGPQPLTPEEAIQRLKDAWTRDHDTRMAAWNAQREQERAEMEEQERLAQEEQEARRAQHEREVEEQRKEAEKKKPKLNSFDPNRSVGRWIKPRPAQYALNKINTLDYVELDYFTTRGCDEAAADANQSLSQDTFGFVQVDGAFTIRPLAAQRASKNIRRDEDLSWEEMLQAKNNMLQFMSDSKVWPKDHAETLTGFFVSLELHPRAQHPNGRQALLLYQSRVRREWFSALKRDEGFNIEIIEEELLRSYAETVDNQIRDRQIDEVRISCPIRQNLADNDLSLLISILLATTQNDTTSIHNHCVPRHHQQPTLPTITRTRGYCLSSYNCRSLLAVLTPPLATFCVRGCCPPSCNCRSLLAALTPPLAAVCVRGCCSLLAASTPPLATVCVRGCCPRCKLPLTAGSADTTACRVCVRGRRSSCPHFNRPYLAWHSTEGPQGHTRL